MRRFGALSQSGTKRNWSAVHGAAVFALLLIFAPSSFAKSVPGVGGGEVSVEEGYTDNVRASSIAKEGAWYTTVLGEGNWERPSRGWFPDRLGGILQARAYSSIPDRNFAAFGPKFGYDWKLVSLTVEYRYTSPHLQVDASAAVGAFADGHDLSAEFRRKFGKNGRWLAEFTYAFAAETYDSNARGRSFFEDNFEAVLRCRVTSWISPRAGVAFSSRDAISTNFDREETSLLLGLDLYLPAEVRGVFRYEKIWRNFLVGNQRDADGQSNGNFGREDDVYKIETGFDVRVPKLGSTTLRMRYSFQKNDSTRLSRTYDSNELDLRLTYSF